VEARAAARAVADAVGSTGTISAAATFRNRTRWWSPVDDAAATSAAADDDDDDDDDARPRALPA
jgi:hypothetical protein